MAREVVEVQVTESVQKALLGRAERFCKRQGATGNTRRNIERLYKLLVQAWKEGVDYGAFDE